MKSITIPILGTDYEVLVGKRKELGLPKSLQGQCYYLAHKIKAEHSHRGEDVSDEERDERTTATIAHEVFHAFCHESGLDIDSDVEEKLACWYEVQWRKMNNCILDILEQFELLD